MTAVALAFALPTALGVLLWIAVLGRPSGHSAWAACLGAGYLLGAIGLGTLLRWAAPLPIGQWPLAIGSALAVAVLAAGGWLGWRWQRLPVVRAAAPVAPAERGLLALLLALLAAHLLFLALQATALPIVAWDAWNAWMGKAHGWSEAGRLLPVVDFGPWWRSPPGTSLAVLAGHYPDSLPRFVTWIAAMHGSWSEPVVTIAWPLLWLALGGLLFGYLRLAGARRSLAAIASYAVLSLPLVNAHVALAGYADLWLAALVLLALVHLQRALRERSRRDAVMAALAIALLPAVKLEGAVWMLCLLAAAAVMLMPPRWRWRLLLPGSLLLVAGLLFGGVHLPLPGLGAVRLQWGLIEIPTLGRLPLFWRPVTGQVLESLFVLPNWHLLWYVLPLATLAGMAASRRDAAQQGGLLFLGGGYAFLFVLFFFTDASAWAENLTSVNRVLLQIVPATVFWVSLLYVGRPAPRGRWS